ncbi:serine-rich adhesin for platelets isoform X2 [Anabrus simplex]|uniref:serine-rich adhesin for platelets isoform X2 n=1 Tax=Anabrus simplex TaxID=316456 RepID=UPI0035A2CC02
MDGRSSKESDPGKQSPDIPLGFNKNVPIGLLHRELGYKQKQRAVPVEFQAAAEDKLVTKEYEELRCELPGISRSTFLMVFSPDGKKVASTHGNHNVYVTDLTTGKNVNTLSGHPRTPWCIAFHPSSNQILASGCLGGQVRVWDLHGGSEVWTADGQTVIASLAFHPTDRLLVIATYNELHFWDWSQPEPFAKCYTNNEKEKVRYVAFDQLGHKLITGISNAPLVQTQWDRVTATGPHPSTNNTPTSQSSSGQNHHHGSAPDRERRITICYRSLVEQYEQLVQRYFDLSRSRTISTMDRGTDPMDLEAETSSSSTQTGPGPSRRREMGTSTGDGGCATSGSAVNTNLSDVPPFDFARARAIVERMNVQGDTPPVGSELEPGAGNTVNNPTSEMTENSAISSEESIPNEENHATDRNRNLMPDTISLNAAGTINISRTQNNAANPGVTLNIPVVENNRLANTINMINSAMNDMHTVIIADTGRQESQSVESDAYNSTRDVGVGPPGDNRVRVHIRTYEVTQSPNQPRFSYPRTSTPVERSSEGSSPNQSQNVQDNPPPTEGPQWQQQGCLFSRLHQQVQPTSPSALVSERPRRFFVSQRSAFQPRTPRADQDGEPQERRYLFPIRSASSNPIAEPVDPPEPESERSSSRSPPIPTQRARVDMTDVGVRYGIQLLSRHIDNMQRLCRARLEILQLQQIRRMWEDLQRQIRSLHMAVRESTLALSGTSDTSANAELRRQFEGSSASGVEQVEGMTSDGNASHIPSVSQMMESARISDGSPRHDRPSDGTSGPVPHPLPLNLVRNLLGIQHGEHVINGQTTSHRNSDGNTSNGITGERTNRLEGEQSDSNSDCRTTGDSNCQSTGELNKQPGGGATQMPVTASTSRNSPTCTVRILNLPQRMKILTGVDLGLRKACHPAGRQCGGNSSQKEQGCSQSAKSSDVQSSGSSTFQTEAGLTANPSRTSSNNQTPNKSSESSDRSSESNRDSSGGSVAPGSGGAGSFTVDSGRTRTGFWLVSTMSNVPSSSSGISTTSTAGSTAVTVPSSIGQAGCSSNTNSSGNQRCHQMLQQRLLRISRKVYLRRPRLLAVAPRSVRRQSGMSHLNPSRAQQGLFRHNEPGRRPWFMQSVMRSQRRSTNTASQVGSINSADISENKNNQAPRQEANNVTMQGAVQEQTDSTRSRLGPHIPKSGEGSSGSHGSGEGSSGSHGSESGSGYFISSQDCAQPGPSDHNSRTSAAAMDSDGKRCDAGGTGVQSSHSSAMSSNSQVSSEGASTSSAPKQLPQSNTTRQEGGSCNGSSGQQETSTSESLRAMIVRLERLVQQQREQREQTRNERERSSQESPCPSRRTNVWELRDVSSSGSLRNYNNSGSDSDSSPESERQQPWDRLSAEERLSQVLSLMVESLTQFFEENGLSHNTPHAVLDEQIYNLYVLLQLALELTDLLLAQLVSTRRELEHQWVHRLRSPVALDATLAGGDHSTSSDRNRDREHRVRGMMYRRYHRHRVHGDTGSEHPDRDRSSDRGSSRGRGECGRRLSSRMMNCLARHNHNFTHHSNNNNCSNNSSNGSGSHQTHSSLGMHPGRLIPSGRGGGQSPSFDRAPGRASPARRTVTNDSNGSPGGIMVRVQQYETRTTTTAAQNTHPTSVTNTTGNMPQHQQHDAFTVPLVRVNDILIPDTAVLNHQPWSRARSPPPRPSSPFRNPFALNVPHEHRMLGAWHELFPYGSSSNWRPRFLHPRYMGHSLYSEEQEDVYHGHPGENFNFIRGNSIVPDTVIITDAPMSPNHRIQVWDFSSLNIPDISNAEKNMIVPECKIHNDASVDVSRDGRLLVTLLPSGRLSITTKLGVYSLQWESLGQCLYTTSFDQSAVSVSLSPASRHLLVGLASRRVALLPNDRHTMAQIFRLEGARLGQGKDGRGRNSGARGRLCHLRDIEQGREQGYMSLNCIRWAPGPGQGFVYGTNTGQLKVLR